MLNSNPKFKIKKLNLLILILKLYYKAIILPKYFIIS